MRKEHIVKLPIGQANVIVKKCRPAKAKGCKMLKGWDKMQSAQIETPFNTPQVTIVLRKVA